MNPVFAAFWKRWSAIGDEDRRDASLASLAGRGFLVHYFSYCMFQPFFIEDAGISFAFAQNWIDGHGFVPYVGGERVEGFSNPLWTMLIGSLYAMGIPVWTSAKVLGGLLGWATLWVVYRLTRLGLVEDSRRARNFALLPLFFLAASPQFVIWEAAGLENPLFGFLVVFGLLRVLQEGDDARRRPLSALCFAALALTRPEGVMYGVVGLLTRGLMAIRDRRFMPLVAWLALFTLPVAVYFRWRLHYFGWELPNTYYAKLGGEERFLPFNWKRQGWKYIREYWNMYWMWWTLPVFGAAMVGFGRGARWAIIASTGLIAGLVFWDGDPNATWVAFHAHLPEGLPLPSRFELPAPALVLRDHWVKLRVGFLLVVSVALGLFVFKRKGWPARGGLWATFAAGMFYIVYVGEDWMDGHRWFSVVVLVMFPLLALGLFEITESLAGQMKWVVAPLVVVCLGINIFQTVVLANSPETAVRDVHRRVQYMSWVQDRLDLDKITLLDVDMGAHMMFTDWHIVDMAGLVDVPIARHRDYNRAFMRQYLYKERRPDFAHVHGGWGKTTKILSHAEFKRDYVEIPGYPIGGDSWHIGNHVRRELLAEKKRGQVEGLERFDPKVLLVSASMPAAGVPPGQRLFVETRWRGARRKHGYTAILFLTDGTHTTLSAMEPGYGWLPPEELKPDETLVNKHWVDVPADFPPGTYQLGIMVVNHEDGRLLSAQRVPMEAPYSGARLLFEGELVVSEGAAQKRRDVGLAAALNNPNCASIWAGFKNASRLVAHDVDWKQAHTAGVQQAEAQCWLTHANTVEGEERVAALIAAMAADSEESRSLAAEMADTLVQRAAELESQEDVENAYLALHHALQLDPTRSQDRRWAERLRTADLGIKATAE